MGRRERAAGLRAKPQPRGGKKERRTRIIDLFIAIIRFFPVRAFSSGTLGGEANRAG
jgi:hypothetical protein